MPARWLVVALVLLARAWPAAAADGVIRLHLPAGTGGSPAFLVRLVPTQGAPEERTAGGDRQVVVFRGVRPGAYRLHIESSGLDPASTDLLIQAWETIIVDATVVTDEGWSRLAMATRDRSQPESASVFSTADARSLPGARDAWAIVETAEARTIVDRIDDGGMYAGEAGRFSLRGASWTQASTMLDGLDLTDPDRGGTPLVHVPLEAVETVGVFADAAGPVLRLEPKRPGAEWHASFDASATPSAWQQGEISLAPSIARFGSWSDAVATASGPIVKDRLGVFALGRVTRAIRFERGAAVELPGKLATLLAHVVYASRPHREARALVIVQRRDAPYVGRPRQTSPGAAQRDQAVHLQGTWARRPVSGWRLGISGAWQQGASDAPDPPVANVAVDRLIDGPIPALFAPSRDIHRFELRLSAEPDLGRFDRGRHAIGLDAAIERTGVDSYAPPDPVTPELVGGLAARVWDYDVANTTTRWRATRVSAGIADTWTPAAAVSVGAGVRVISQRGSADGAGSIDWTSLSPALSVRLRPGSMPLVFFGAVERAPARLLLRDLASGDPNGPQGRVSIWDDRNGNRQFEPGEQGPVVAWVGPGGSNSTIDPNLRPPEATQITAGVLLDRGGWRVSLTGVRRRELDLVESVNVGVPLPGYRVRLVPDPGVDYVGPQDDRLLPIFDRDPDTFGEDQYLLTNPDGHDMLHEGIELFVERHVGQRLRLAAGATASRSQGSAGNRGFRVLENDAGVVGELHDNPNADTYSRGRLFFDRAFTIKISARYESTRDFLAGVVARYQDGQPFARIVVATGLAQGPEPVQAVSRGDHRFTYTATLDARVEKGFRAGRARIAGVVEVFNLLGLQHEVEENVVTGPAFRQVVAVQPPRAIRVGVRIER